MSRFSVSFSIDTGDLNQPFQSLTAAQSPPRLRQINSALPGEHLYLKVCLLNYLKGILTK